MIKVNMIRTLIENCYDITIDPRWILQNLLLIIEDDLEADKKSVDDKSSDRCCGDFAKCSDACAPRADYWKHRALNKPKNSIEYSIELSQEEVEQLAQKILQAIRTNGTI